MLVVTVMGVFSLRNIPSEILPSISTGAVAVSVAYPGASASEVEQAICTRLEAAVAGLDGVRDSQTIAHENGCTANVRAKNGVDSARLAADVRRQVESISTFPPKALKPVVVEVLNRDLVGSIVVYGPTEAPVLRAVAERLRVQLLRDRTITTVELSDIQPYEIALNLPQDALTRYQLSAAEVANAVRMSSVDLPAGTVREDGQNISIMVRGAGADSAAFEDIVVRAKPDGARLQVSDIASVTEGYSDTSFRSEFNGQPAVMLAVYRAAGEDVLRIADAVKNTISAAPSALPAGLNIALWQDTAKYLKQRMDSLASNTLQSILLVMLILGVFMRPRHAFWTSADILFSFLCAIIAMHLLGMTLNMVTLFAFLMVIGIVVDDAIVICDAVYERNAKGEWGVAATVRGVQDVATPVVLSSLTTMITFIPLLFIPYAVGELIASIPIVVILTLGFSLFEALFMLPNHLAYARPLPQRPVSAISMAVARMSKRMSDFAEYRYRPLLVRTINYRYAIITGFLMLMLLGVGLLASGRLPVVFYSQVEGDTVVASIAFSEGTDVTKTKAAVETLVAAIRDIGQKSEAEYGQRQIENIFSSAGGATGKHGGHFGSVTVELAGADTRQLSGEDVANRWRTAVGAIPDVQSLTFSSSLTTAVPDLEVELYGSNLESLISASQRLARDIEALQGVYGVHSSYGQGGREVALELRPSAADSGLTLASLADQVRQAFQGLDVQSFQRGLSEATVTVRHPDAQRDSGWYLENMPIQLPTGGVAPLASVAQLTYGSGPREINRRDGDRVAQVSASVDKALASTVEVTNAIERKLLPAVLVDYPDVQWRRSGLTQRTQVYKSYLLWAFLLATLVNYAMMAVMLRNFTQPLLVLYAIPFGAVGALLGHLLMGIELSIWSIAGVIAVSGIVVNDNLVYIDYINQRRQQGASIRDAILAAGQARFRSIVLTSLTTFLGLSSIMFAGDITTQFLLPMAVSVAFGELFATFITLIMLPATYTAMDDIQQWVAGLFGRKSAHGDSVPAASELGGG